MAVLDGVLLGILLVSMLLGAWRGLVFELFSLIGWVAGFFIARLFAPDVAAWLVFSREEEEEDPAPRRMKRTLVTSCRNIPSHRY